MKILSQIIKKFPQSQFKWKLIILLGRIYNFNIRIAETEEDLNTIYKFRYEVYVNQLNRKQKYANHKEKQVKEPLDNHGINIGAWRRNELVGVVRVNLKKGGDFDYYSDLYKIQLFNGLVDNSSMVTKLIIAKKYRKTPLSLLLSLKCYEIGSRNNVEINFIDCNEHLLKYFMMLGYRCYINCIEHPEYGKVTPLVLINQDIDYLMNINSPFVPICKTNDISERGAIFYSTEFSNLKIKI